MIVKTLKILRNNWKKSTFGFLVLTYGIASTKKKYDTNIVMRACCEEALKFGEARIPATVNPRAITVILNPAANKRSAKADYEAYCEPLLHLAGISVKVMLTNSEGHAKELVEELPETESIIVAGGDGTLSEAITGLLRKDEKNNTRTIGILPLGRRNTVGNKLFPLGNKLAKVRQLTDATMAIIKNETLPKDIMKVEALETETEIPGKPIFAVGAIEWGAFRDAFAKRDKYWIYGGLRDYATFIFNGYKSSLCWDCKGTIKYTPPCHGCNNCRQAVVPKPKLFRWLDFIMPKEKDDNTGVDFKNIVNENCANVEEKCFKTTDFVLSTVRGDNGAPSHLAITLGKMNMGYSEFVSEGWRRVNEKPPKINETVKARSIEIFPLNVSKEGKEIWFGIDNEEFDVKPIKITILPDAVKVFCKTGTLAN